MKRFARMLFAGLGIAIAGSAMSLVPHRVATAGGMTAVTVTNPTLAVTQSGPWNVGINGMPTVQLAGGSNVGINGVPTVQVMGTPTVQLAPGAFSNTPSTPIFTRDRDNPTLAPFETTLCSNLNFGGSCGGQPPETFTVGANRLVIEYVSVKCTKTGAGSFLSGTELSYKNVGALFSTIYSFPPGQLDSIGQTFISNQQTRIYVDPGTLVTFQANGFPGTGSLSCIATVSGYSVTP